MENNIEVEIRSFISKKQYDYFLKFFKKEGKFLGKQNQTTYYFSGENDLRIQKSDKFAKLWLKSGKIHDKFREDIEVKCDKKYFENLGKILLALGFEVKIEWFRKRNEFLWQGVKVSVDATNGYGYIIELEKMVKKGKEAKAYQLLEKKIKGLGMDIIPKEVFDKKFNYYKNNWKKLIKK